MRTLLAALALATAIASPAFADPYDAHNNPGRWTARQEAVNAYAYMPSEHRNKISTMWHDRGLAAFGDSIDHLLPGEIDDPGPR